MRAYSPSRMRGTTFQMRSVWKRMTYKIQQLSLGGVLDQAISIVKDHFGVLFSIMLIVLVPFSLITGFLQLAIAPPLPENPTTADFEQVQQAYVTYWPLFTLFGLINGLFILPLTNASVIYAVAKLYLGKPISAIGAISQGMKRIIPLIGTSILMYLAVFGGLILLIIPGILFALWFGLSQHVVVIEEESGTKALGRSKKLVRPHLGTFLMLGIVMFAITFGVGLMGGLVTQPHLSLIVSTLLHAATTILWTAAGVVFYFSCRCAEENFDLYYLAEAIGEEPQEAEDFTAPSYSRDM